MVGCKFEILKTATLPEKINVLGDAAPTVNSTQTTSSSASTNANEGQNTKIEIVTKANPWLWAWHSLVCYSSCAKCLCNSLRTRLKQLQTEQEKG